MKGQHRKHGNGDPTMSKERIFMEAFSLARNESGEEAGGGGGTVGALALDYAFDRR